VISFLEYDQTLLKSLKEHAHDNPVSRQLCLPQSHLKSRSMRNEIPGESGIIGIILATGATCFVMTVVTGMWSQWLLCGAGVVMGLWAVQVINKR